MYDAPDRSSLDDEVRRLRTQLTESEERVTKFRKACTHWKIQHTRLLETVQQQQPMDEGGAPTRPRSPIASVGTANGDGARTPPKKNALSLNDVVRAEKAVLEAASEALALWQPRARVLAKGAAAGAASTSSGQPASVIVFAAGFCEDFSPREVSSSLLPRPACFETRCFRGASRTLTGTTTPMGPGTPVGPAHPTQHAALHLPPRTLGSFPDLPRHISPPVSRHHLHQPVTPHRSGRLG